MAQPWDEYLGLQGDDKFNWPVVTPIVASLLSKLQAGAAEPSHDVRRRLLVALLSSLSPSSTSTSSQTLTPTSPPSTLYPILALIKLLGRSAAGSEELARERGLTILLTYGGLASASKLPVKRTKARRDRDEGLGITELGDDEDPAVEEDPLTPMPRSEERDPLAPSEAEALRSLCNVLMLHPAAREAFPAVLMEDRTWLHGMVRLLNVPGAGFLAGRLLFLLTTMPSDLVAELVEKTDAVDLLEEYANLYLADLTSPSPSVNASLTSGPLPTRTDILREHFKFVYNLMLQYGRLPARPGRTPPPTAPSPAPSSTRTDDESVSEMSDAQTDDGAAAGDTSPVTSTANGKKKRFWRKGNGGSEDGDAASNTSTSPSTSPTISTLASSNPGPGSAKRSRSPRALAQRIKSAVTGSKSAATSTTPTPGAAHSVTTNNAPTDDGLSSGELSIASVSYFLPLFKPYLSLAVLLPLDPITSQNDGKDPSPLVRNALNTLLNFPIQLEEMDGYDLSWLQPVAHARPAYPSLSPLPSRLLELLDKSTKAWFPPNKVGTTAEGKKTTRLPAMPDELLSRGAGDANRAEEILGPIVLLLRKVSLLTEPVMAMREILMPKNIDRTVSLDRRPDLTGQLVRLLSSILLPNTAYGVGEFIYNLCDRDATILSQTIGYGNAAGFLQNRGELIPPPAMPEDEVDEEEEREAREKEPRRWEEGVSKGKAAFPTTEKEPKVSAVPFPPSATKKVVNPITGAYEDPNARPAMEGMSEEEKEREAEKLYVLFDRMAKTGVMEVENPVHKARKEGKLEGNKEEREREEREEKEREEREEREALDELRRYKERKAKLAAE
ncbi:guanine nucleotide exchange factor, Ric8 [Pseudohyphozyma bogoriensis]|nr:guanine nucleotide exchange factor, Ric8 [Pseudohyphozyma bogoriensis]